MTLHLVGDPAVGKRFDQRLIGVLEAGILADNCNGDVALRVLDALVDPTPADEVGIPAGINAKRRKHFAIEAGLVIGLGHGINIVDVARLDDRALADIAEQAELAAFLPGDRPVAAAKQNVGLDADRTELLDGVLRRFGLELAGSRDERQRA